MKPITLPANPVRQVLSDGGATEWRIVVGARAAEPERYAAAELQRFLEQIGGAVLPVVEDTEPVVRNEIRLGFHARFHESQAAATDPEWFAGLGQEGYVILSEGDSLLIAGGGPRGTLYGVYDFLESQLGCRWFGESVSRIPRRSRIEIGPLRIRRLPALEYREPYFGDTEDGDWSARNRTNGQFSTLEARHGGKMKYVQPWCHTFEALVPPGEYFDEHPEYFSEVGGVRLREKSQLCLTNEDVYRIALRRVREWIDANPDCNIVSVSQNDWENPCECASCRAVDEEEGNYSGTLIRFVNRIAEALEPDYPDLIVDTLAYQYTRKAPLHVRPRPNVAVRLCSIECCFSHPLASCGEKLLLKNSAGTGATFVQDLQDWAAVCDRLYIWDYTTNFSNYVFPFPNLFVLKPNLQLFAQNNVKGVFALGSYANGGGGEFAELRMYLLAKLMWDPDADDSFLIDEFLAGYYGAGGPHIRRYIDELHRIVDENGIHASIYDRTDAEFVTEELLGFADECFDRAERVAEDDVTLRRIRAARLPIRYARLFNVPPGTPGRDEAIGAFRADVESYGIRALREHETVAQTLDQMRQGIVFTHFARYEGGWSPI